MISVPDERTKMACIEKMTQHLCTLRTVLHMTQADLALLIGVARSTILYIEKRARKMTWSTYLSLVFVFYQNKETRELLRLFDIYPDELKKLYSNIN